MKRTAVAVFALVLCLSQGLVPAMAAMAQPGPRDPRGTQLYRGTAEGGDAGRPMIAACVGEQPCRFVGLVDPDRLIAGPFTLDSGYVAVCTPGACFTPAPFVASPALLGSTTVAAGAGLTPAVAAGSILVISAGIVGGVVGTTRNTVQTGSR